MRLSGWRDRAPHKDTLGPKVLAVLQPVLSTLGAMDDPECWIVWGDDPTSRYTVLVPTAAGLLLVNVRVNVPQEGPRAGGKLIRWNRVQTGELALEMSDGHRLLSFQAEGQVLRGADVEAEDIAAFALDVFAAQDGRPWPSASRPRKSAARPGRKATMTVARRERSAPAPRAAPTATAADEASTLPQLPAPRQGTD